MRSRNAAPVSASRRHAAGLYDAAQPCGAESNMAKLLAADASWEAANVCMRTHGGYGFATEYDIERKFREARLYQVAPISTNLILSYAAEHVLGLPRSYADPDQCVPIPVALPCHSSMIAPRYGTMRNPQF